MNIIVFSKDRACQLELFLRSMSEYFREFNSFKINILYTYSNEFFKNGYDKLINKYYTNINWIKENNFKNDLLSVINKNEKYTIFFVDDIIWKNYFSIKDEEFKIFEQDERILTLSLRLHPNLTYCYTMNIPLTPTKSKIWKWRGLAGDYGYPMSLDGHFFRTTEIINLLNILEYKNPNQLEALLAINPINKPLMLCYDKSIIFNNPINKVQTNNPNRHGNITAEYLNQEFLKGFIIDLEKFRHIDNESCHKEIPIKFI